MTLKIMLYGYIEMANVRWYGNERKSDIKNNAKDIIMEKGYFVEEQAKRLCPVDTGTLRSSIHTKYNPVEVAVYIGTNKDAMLKASQTGTVTFYAPYVEFGTYKMKPRPFLRPALDMLRATRGMK